MVMVSMLFHHRFTSKHFFTTRMGALEFLRTGFPAQSLMRHQIFFMSESLLTGWAGEQFVDLFRAFLPHMPSTQILPWKSAWAETALNMVFLMTPTFHMKVIISLVFNLHPSFRTLSLIHDVNTPTISNEMKFSMDSLPFIVVRSSKRGFP